MPDHDNQTLLESIIAQAKPEGELIRLPGFDAGKEITVRVKRPALHQLMAADAALNPLLPKLDELFVQHSYKDAKAPTEDYNRAVREIAKATLIEPTWEELEAAGVVLTDDQLLELSLYATEGASFQATFRETARRGIGKPGDTVPHAAQPAAAPE